MKQTIFIAALLSLLLPPAVAAAVFLGGETALLSEDVTEDVYMAGGKVVADQATGGDLVAVGGSLLVIGSVGEDLIIAGGSITVNGPVGDDLRGSGGEINIIGPVGDDVIVAGGSITVASGATIDGDLVATGGSILIAGTVRGDVRAVGGDIVVHGTVLGNSDVRAYSRLWIDGRLEGDATFAAHRITLGREAAFGGNVEYWQQAGELDFSGVPTAGSATFNPHLKLHSLVFRGMLGVAGLWLGFALLSGALLIFLFVAAAGGWFTETGEALEDAFWRNFGYGLLYFLLMPMLALVLFITVIGIPLGLFTLVLYFFSLLFAPPVTAVVLAKWIEARNASIWGKPFLVLVSFLLLVLIRLLLLIPALGWITAAIFICAAFGAIFENLSSNLN